VRNA